MASRRKQDLITPEQYWEIQRSAEFRSEYISGEMIAMAAPSKAHGLIIANLAAGLHSRLKNTPCQPNVGLAVAAPSAYLIPDLVVYHNGGSLSGESDILLDPVVIIEVLSASTSDYDHGRKWTLYQQIDSLQHYVMVSQEMPRIEVYSKEPGGGWYYVVPSGLDSMISLAAIDCRLTLADIYERVLPAD